MNKFQKVACQMSRDFNNKYSISCQYKFSKLRNSYLITLKNLHTNIYDALRYKNIEKELPF